MDENNKAVKGATSKEQPLLAVENLSVSFFVAGLQKRVTEGVSFSLKEGEILGIAGESGSGKSMTALAVMGLLPAEAVRECTDISFGGKSLCYSGKKGKKKEEKARQALSGKEMAMIFQEPLTSLNPVLTIGRQMEEPLLLHTELTKEQRKEEIIQALSRAELKHPEKLLALYPHHLSGGMRQRVMIAMAMMNKPRLLIADEPTTALDAVTEREIVELIRRQAKENNTAVLFISHDLSLLSSLCDRVMIMKDGRIVEEGETLRIFTAPEHAYTKKLLAAAKGGKREQALLSQKETPLLLSVKELSVRYKRSGLFAVKEENNVVSGVSFAVKEKEIFGIVGESGCGKSTLLKVIAGLHREFDGVVERRGQEMRQQKTVGKRTGKPGVSMVFQDPYTSLNPAKTVGWILEEPLRLNTDLKKEERRSRVKELLAETELPEDVIGRPVSELSGGQRQRVAIAAALITNPELVLLDEPVSALDVTVQVQILELLLRLQKEHGLTYVFVSHDMSVVRKICDRVMVMKDGMVVECGQTEQMFANPKEAYTKKLLGEKEISHSAKKQLTRQGM